jgi:hypothetical protein
MSAIRRYAMSAVRRYASGGPWEDKVGYSRVVGAGPWLVTAGCTSTVDGVVAHVGDAGAVGAVHAELSTAYDRSRR